MLIALVEVQGLCQGTIVHPAVTRLTEVQHREVALTEVDLLQEQEVVLEPIHQEVPLQEAQVAVHKVVVPTEAQAAVPEVQVAAPEAVNLTEAPRLKAAIIAQVVEVQEVVLEVLQAVVLEVLVVALQDLQVQGEVAVEEDNKLEIFKILS